MTHLYNGLSDRIARTFEAAFVVAGPSSLALPFVPDGKGGKIIHAPFVLPNGGILAHAPDGRRCDFASADNGLGWLERSVAVADA
jgi:hypothetical protein